MKTSLLLLVLGAVLITGPSVAGNTEISMTTSEKQDTRLVQLPSGDWVVPSSIQAIRKNTRYKSGDIVVEPYVAVIGKLFGHIVIEVGDDGELQAMADRIAAIANTAPEAAE